ncbi:hypothetical protein SAMN04490247_1003 [Salimicrobium halophilum]|uniref:EamA domain-containing protein n=1 Tax=Salimicrobium halophilum TaxID=86666 RepID=A0A1G8RFB7_9BACI|nr:hypothetical protein SAMN04490247_1003 [Salimicrobium halophilum]
MVIENLPSKLNSLRNFTTIGTVVAYYYFNTISPHLTIYIILAIGIPSTVVNLIIYYKLKNEIQIKIETVFLVILIGVGIYLAFLLFTY